jgi:hypothetical protein
LHNPRPKGFVTGQYRASRKKMKQERKNGLFLSSLLLLTGLALLYLTHTPTVNAQGPIPSRVFFPMIIAGCPRLLVQDSGFEAVPNISWGISSTVGSTILDSSSIPSPNPTHSGLRKAWLGGNDSAQESVWQTMTVPASTTGMQVSFWSRVSTQETNPSTNDRLDVQIRNNSGTPLETVYTLWDGDAGTTWVQHTLSPVGNYTGQTIQIAFFAKTDATNPTSFFIDDVSVQAACSP